jgi:hypothetical protein
VMFAAITTLTLVVSSLTYLMVERPMIKLGNVLTDRVSRRVLALT